MPRGKKVTETIIDSPWIMTLWDAEKNSDDPEVVSLHSKQRYHFTCPIHGTEFQMCLHVLRGGSTGCYACQRKPLLSKVSPSLEKHYSIENKVPFIHATVSRQKALYICNACGNEFEAENREMAKLLNDPLCKKMHDSVGEVLDRLHLTLIDEHYSSEEIHSLRQESSIHPIMLYYRCPKGHEAKGTARSLRYHSNAESACCNNMKAMHRLASVAPQLEAIYSSDNEESFQEVFCTRGELFNWTKGYFYKRSSYPVMLGDSPWRKSAMTPIPGFNTLKDTYPQLAGQLLNPENATHLHCYSQGKVEWICDAHPKITYTMRVMERTKRGRGCPYCANRLLLSGYNDAAMRYPEQMKLLDEAGRALAATVFPSSSTKVMWHCLDNPTSPSLWKDLQGGARSRASVPKLRSDGNIRHGEGVR